MSQPPPTDPESTPASKPPAVGRENSEHAPPLITRRAIVLGILTITGMFYYIVQVGEGLGVAQFVKGELPMAFWMPFVIWIFLNIGIKRLWPRIALRQGEMLTLFAMLWVVGTIPQLGWANYWLFILTVPTAFATVENQWAEAFFDYMPWHVYPPASTDFMDYFWNGLPEGMALPWDSWMPVMAQWLSVSMGMLIFGLCLLVVFNRQWVEAEKLSFPLAQMPQDLTRGFDGKRRLPDIFYTRLFWVGFALVFLPTAYNMITYFSPGLPQARLYWEHYNLQIGPHVPRGIWFRVMPLVIAMTYLCPLDIMGSLLAFYALTIPKEWVMRRVGFSAGAPDQEIGPIEVLYMESYGALIFIAFWSIWLARRHLRGVWHHVRYGSGDRRDVRLYRWALAGMAFSMIYVVSWAVTLGVSVPLALFTFVLMALVYFVTSKLIAATGFAYLFPNDPHLKGETFVIDLIGTTNLENRNLVAYKVFTSKAFFGDLRLQAWPAVTHVLRIFSLRLQPAWIAALVIVAYPVGFIIGMGATIDLAYEVGGGPMAGAATLFVAVYDRTAHLLLNPTSPDVEKTLLWIMGFFEAAGIAYLRARFHWFPIHPLGLAFQYTFGTWLYWFSLFLVWCAKLAVLRIGGVQAFLTGKPLFYGLAIGYVVGVTISGLVDLAWFPSEAHRVHDW